MKNLACLVAIFYVLSSFYVGFNSSTTLVCWVGIIAWFYIPVVYEKWCTCAPFFVELRHKARTAIAEEYF